MKFKLINNSITGNLGMIGSSRGMIKLYSEIEKVAISDSSVLISAETGTGKELVAKAIHNLSPRRYGEFIALNCSAFPKELLEGELFGYMKGSYTGAIKDKAGIIEKKRSTIFLDEIGHMSPELQPKLLRVLQEKRSRRIGSDTEKEIDVRFIAATSRSFEELRNPDNFNNALYYRLNTLPITIPSLREREEDIPILVNHFFNEYSKIYQKERQLDDNVIKRLSEYHWPGNVRQLISFIEMLVVKSEEEKISDEYVKEQLELTEGRKVKSIDDKISSLEIQMSSLLKKHENLSEQIYDFESSIQRSYILHLREIDKLLNKKNNLSIEKSKKRVYSLEEIREIFNMIRGVNGLEKKSTNIFPHEKNLLMKRKEQSSKEASQTNLPLTRSYFIDDISKIVGVNKSGLYHAIREGKIIAKKEGRRKLVSLPQLKKYYKRTKNKKALEKIDDFEKNQKES